MNDSIRRLTVLLGIFLLSACGGGDGGSSPSAPVVPPSATPPQPSPQAPLSTSDIQANANFNFRVDDTININLSKAPPGKGVINIYYAAEHYDENLDRYYPDYATLIASWRPTINESHRITFNKNWKGLLFEWIPESAEQMEQSYFFESDQLQTELFLDLL
jgi:hypothetical protein